MQERNSSKYYTYAYLREDGTPYYIGKGCGDRIKAKGKRTLKVPPRERRIFLKINMTQEEALKHERYMIAVLGRKDLGTGILRNLTDGGDGCVGLSTEARNKISIKGKEIRSDPEWKRRQSEILKEYFRKNGTREISDEERQRQRERMLGSSASLETRKKMSESAKKRGCNTLGYSPSLETRKKMSESAKKRGCNAKPWLDKKQPIEMIEKRCDKLRKNILITFPDGTTQIVRGQKEASRITGQSTSTIKQYLHGSRTNNRKGYKFEYVV